MTEGGNFEKAQGDKSGPFNLAVVVQDRPAEGTDKRTRIMVVGTSLLLDSSATSQFPGNANFLMNSMSWLRGRREELGKTTAEIVSVLLWAGAGVNDRDDEGWTPLMYAARCSDNPKVITALLQAGADGKVKNEDGKTAFDLAKENERLKDTKEYWDLNNARF